MWRQYMNVIASRARNTIHIFDRFHVMKKQNEKIDKVRAKEARRLKSNLRSVRAYLMREDLQRVWQYSRPKWAGKFLDQWCVRAMRSKIEPMKKMGGTLRRHRTILLNWFHARGAISNWSVEGMNNKAKLGIKKAYGFKSYKT